mgnify:CR=1 FL=1|tara:strand:- start:301 stop:657 length:357 start_codon:yes stop_codon:yes gene_type:complete
MNIPKTIYSDRNKIEIINEFIDSISFYHEGFPVVIARSIIKDEVLCSYGINIDFVEVDYGGGELYSKRNAPNRYTMAYTIEVSNKKKELLLELLNNKTQDTVILKINTTYKSSTYERY